MTLVFDRNIEATELLLNVIDYGISFLQCCTDFGKTALPKKQENILS